MPSTFAVSSGGVSAGGGQSVGGNSAGGGGGELSFEVAFHGVASPLPAREPDHGADSDYLADDDGRLEWYAFLFLNNDRHSQRPNVFCFLLIPVMTVLFEF
jgi:hypothetical protein